MNNLHCLWNLERSRLKQDIKVWICGKMQQQILIKKVKYSNINIRILNIHFHSLWLVSYQYVPNNLGKLYRWMHKKFLSQRGLFLIWSDRIKNERERLNIVELYFKQKRGSDLSENQSEKRANPPWLQKASSQIPLPLSRQDMNQFKNLIFERLGEYHHSLIQKV